MNLKEKIQAERLSGKIPSGNAIVRTGFDKILSWSRSALTALLRVSKHMLKVTEKILINFANLLGLSMRETEDQLTRDTLASSATIYRSTGGTNGDLPTNMSLPDIDTVTTMLDGADAHMILDSIVGEDRIGKYKLSFIMTPDADVKSLVIDLEAVA